LLRINLVSVIWQRCMVYRAEK